jgi:hypothetical protein
VKCYRCGSAMIYEKFYGFQEHFLGWKCIFCGEIIDQVILENRGDPRAGWPKKDKERTEVNSDDNDRRQIKKHLNWEGI